MNVLRSRLWRTIILFVGGLGLSFLVAAIAAPYWPGFCDDTIVGASCDAVAVQTMMGYLVIVLGILTIILGPIAGSLLDLYVNGARWETPRGSENIITNMPILVGSIYVVVGLLIVISA